VLPLGAPRRVRGLMFRSISSKNRTPKLRLVCYTASSSIGRTTYQIWSAGTRKAGKSCIHGGSGRLSWL
jgi:hypothetical protein